MSEQSLSELHEFQRDVGLRDSKFESVRYTPLKLLSNDAYITYSDDNNSPIQYQGKLWGQKEVSGNGMTELLLMQQKKADGKYGNWTQFIYRSKDPDASVENILDQVRRVDKDPSASNRVNVLGYFVSWLLIVLLIVALVFDIELQATLEVMAALFFAVLSIVITFYYEIERVSKDLVHTAKFYPDAPSVPMARSFVHPVSNEVMRITGEAIPIVIDTSKVSYSTHRGYTLHELSSEIRFVTEIAQFRKRAINFMQYKANTKQKLENGKTSKEDKKVIRDEIKTRSDDLIDERERLISKYSKQIDDPDFWEEIEKAKDHFVDRIFENKVMDEILFDLRSQTELHTKYTQVKIERDRLERDVEMWMQKSNEHQNNTNVIVAATVASIIRNRSIVHNYVDQDLPNKSEIKNVNNQLIMAVLSGFMVAVVIFIVGMIIHDAVQSALLNLGEWSSMVLIICIVVISLGIGFFTFNWLRFRLVDEMRNTKDSQKVVKV